MTRIKSIVAVSLLVFAGLLQAATITRPFEAVVQTVNTANADQIGIAVNDVFRGQFSYDDATFPPGSITIPAPFISFNFRGSTNPIFSRWVTLSPNGALVDLDFDLDQPGFLSFRTSMLRFNFEIFSFDPDRGQAVQIANGSGIIREPAAVPLPAAAWLFLSGLGLLARRHRVVS